MPSSSIAMTTVAATDQSQRWPICTFSPPFIRSSPTEIDSKESSRGSLSQSDIASTPLSTVRRPKAIVIPARYKNLESFNFPASFNRHLEIDMHKEIRLTSALGAGAFGQVFKADCGVPGLPPQVAVKQLKEGKYSSKFLKQLEEHFKCRMF